MAQPSESTHHVHPGDLPYSIPVMRSASPNGSINTDYGPDQTSVSELMMNDHDFESMIHNMLGLDTQREQEYQAQMSPLLTRPKNPQEEKILFDRVMQNLNRQVAMLEQDEIMESIIIRTARIIPETQPSTNDIDSILQSMMGPPLHSNLTSTTHTQGTTNTALEVDDGGPGPFDFNFLRGDDEATANEALGTSSELNRNRFGLGRGRG